MSPLLEDDDMTAVLQIGTLCVALTAGYGAFSTFNTITTGLPYKLIAPSDLEMTWHCAVPYQSQDCLEAEDDLNKKISLLQQAADIFR
jgi:hypothetical protein